MAALLSACATENSKFIEIKPENESTSVIYIYRPASFSNVMISPDIIINGKSRYKVKNNSYSYVIVPQGRTTVKLDVDKRYTGIQQRVINVEAAKVYYLRVSTSLKFAKNKPYSRSFDIQQITKNIALNEMLKSEYAGKDKNNRLNISNDEHNSTSNDSSNGQFSKSKTTNPFSK